MFESLKFPPDARILEVGFGHGNWAAWVCQQVPQGTVLAVDVDPNMLKWAQEQFPSSSYPNLEYRLGDALTLDFEAEPFDYVMSNACLHYLDHPGLAFEAMARHLKPGGRFCMVCLGFGNLRDLHKALAKVMRDRRWADCFADFKPQQLADGASCDAWLEKAGLVKKQARLQNEVMNFPNRVHFQEWVNTSFGHYFDKLPGLLRQDFSNELVATYCRRLGPMDEVKALRVWLQLDAVKPAASSGC